METITDSPENDLELELSERGLESDVKLPYVLRNHVIFSPGIHNDVEYTSQVIREAFHNTTWNKRSRSLYLDHKDEFTFDPITGKRTKHIGANVPDWCGEVDNLKLNDNGEIVGDIILVDKPTAMKIEYGARFGVSPRGSGEPDGTGKRVKSLNIDNWSIVINPAIKTTFFNMEIVPPKIKLTNKNNMEAKNTMKKDVKELQDEGKDEDKPKDTPEDKPEDKGGEESSELKSLTEKVNSLTENIKELKKEKDEEELAKKKEEEEELKKKKDDEEILAKKKKEEELKNKEDYTPKKLSEEEELAKKKEEEEELKKKDEEEELKKKKEEYPDEKMSDEELEQFMDEVMDNSDWTDFVKKGRKEGKSLKQIAKEYKKVKKEHSEDEMKEELKELKTEIKEIKELAQKPDIQSSKALSGGMSGVVDPTATDEKMLKYMKDFGTPI